MNKPLVGMPDFFFLDRMSSVTVFEEVSVLVFFLFDITVFFMSYTSRAAVALAYMELHQQSEIGLDHKWREDCHLQLRLSHGRR